MMPKRGRPRGKERSLRPPTPPGRLYSPAGLRRPRDEFGRVCRSATNRTYTEMATHYATAILPTRPRKPRDKAKVERAVLIVERWLLGRLRRRNFLQPGGTERRHRRNAEATQ